MSRRLARLAARRRTAFKSALRPQCSARFGTSLDESNKRRRRLAKAPFSTTPETSSSPKGILERIDHLLSREVTTAPEKFNRYLAFPGTVLVQISIGSVYAWSIFNNPLAREYGVVCAAAGDWTLPSIVSIFSLCAVSLGFTTFFLGEWAERSGPRKVSATAAVLWGSGLVTAGLGTYLHALPLLYFGYGVLGGMGWGLGYISPVSNLLKWFPDRRGLGTGLALTIFGGGAVVASPVYQHLLAKYFVAPDYLGPVESVSLITQEGKRFADVAGQLKEVVVANASDLSKIGVEGLQEGVYVVGTGNTGAAMTFVTLAGAYTTAMMIGAFMQKIPHPNWKPDNWTPPDPAAELAKQKGSIDSNQALSTPQFFLFCTCIWGNAVAGVSIISCGSGIMTEAFGTIFPALVTTGFCAKYVSGLSACNAIGRFGWANMSDLITRKGTYYTFGLGIPIAFTLPMLMENAVTSGSGSTLPLYLFIGGTCYMVSCYGGVFSVLPPYLLETFGSKNVGAIHGKCLTAWAMAALTGPAIFTRLRGRSTQFYIEQLAEKTDPATFETTFGAPVANLDELVSTKTVTIAKLMEICPSGTLDPTPFVYNTSFYTMAVGIGIAVLANSLIRPIPSILAAQGGGTGNVPETGKPQAFLAPQGVSPFPPEETGLALRPRKSTLPIPFTPYFPTDLERMRF